MFGSRQLTSSRNMFVFGADDVDMMMMMVLMMIVMMMTIDDEL